MTNSSSLSKAATLPILIAALGVGVMVFAANKASPSPIEIGLGAWIVLLSIAVAIYVRRAACTIRNYTAAIEKIAEGDFETRLVNLTERGDLAALATSLNRVVDLTDAFLREVDHSMNYVSNGLYFRKVIDRGLPSLYRRSGEALNRVTRATEQRVATFTKRTDDFESKVNGIVESLAADSSRLQDDAAILSDTAEKASSRSSANAEAANRATANVQNVASAAEELTASISEISRQVEQSSTKATMAASEVEETSRLMRSLNETSEKVSGVVNLINDIASQTNLLALNATIEAARAGEAGKGFAVVAGEVKSLAAQTAKATEEIVEQIGAMQSATTRAVDAVQHIGAVVHEVSAIAGTIAEAIDQQLIATREIAQNIQQAAISTHEVTNNTGEVSAAAAATKDAAAEVLDTAKAFTLQSKTIKSQVQDFLKVARQK